MAWSHQVNGGLMLRNDINQIDDRAPTLTPLGMAASAQPSRLDTLALIAGPRGAVLANGAGNLEVWTHDTTPAPPPDVERNADPIHVAPEGWVP